MHDVPNNDNLKALYFSYDEEDGTHCILSKKLTFELKTFLIRMQALYQLSYKLQKFRFSYAVYCLIKSVF